MNKDEIFNGVVDVLVKNFHVKKADVRLESLLDDDLGLDSVDVMDSIYYLEDDFKVQLLDENSNSKFEVKTISDVVDHIIKRFKLKNE